MSGQPRIAGTRISVLDIIELRDAGYSRDEIADELGVTTSDVSASITYFSENRSELREYELERQDLGGGKDERAEV